MEARPGWANLFRKYEIGVALLPRDWPLAELLGKDPAWRRIREDGLGVLYERWSSTSRIPQFGRYKEGQTD
jgi:hypothetical protein